MKRLLVPTDFSECANRAARTALEMAKIAKSEIHFLHFMDIPIDWIQMEHGQDRLYADITTDVSEVKTMLIEMVNKAEKEGVTAKYFIRYNESPAGIIEHIQDHQIDLVIMGSHGASGIKELFIGSNAQKIVRLSPVPVFIIKEPYEEIEKPELVFVSEYEPEAIGALEDLLSFARLLHAKIHLLYINTPSYFVDTWEIQHKMESFVFMGGKQIEKVEILDAYVYEEGLNRYCEHLKKGIVAMATHGRKGLSRVFHGSMAEKVVNHIRFPVLSFKIKEHEEELMEPAI